MDKEHQLLEIADQQLGYFTTRQAEACGFSRPNFYRKIQSGKWIKEKIRGIYRLSNYPYMQHAELALWTLWSADKQGNPQGIYSHETALEIHGLSDVSPAKLHLSVRRGFRKGTPIPKHLSLHVVDAMASSDVENRQGYRVTTPMRTLVDIIRQESTQLEQVQLAILDLALQKALIKGFATIQEIEKLREITDSPALREVIEKAIDEIWTQANVQLKELGEKIEPYTVGLAWGDNGFGSAVLCQSQKQYFLLTAAHVCDAIRVAKHVRIVVRFDNLRREYPVHSLKNFTFINWDATFDQTTLDDVLVQQPKDIAFIIPPSEVIEILQNYKAFYKIPEEPSVISMQEALISLTSHLKLGPYAFVASRYEQLSDVDYIVCPVSKSTYGRKEMSSFSGFGGSGLWKFEKNAPVLIGIAIAQDPGGVYFHGPHSIQYALSNLVKKS